MCIQRVVELYRSRPAGILITCVIMFFMTLSGKAGSSPVGYDESVSGDISLFQGDPVFGFDIGLNTITGSASASAISPVFLSDFDNFAFIVPQGSILTSIIYEFSNVVTGGPGGVNTRYGFYEDSVLNSVFAQQVTPEFHTSPVSFNLASLPFNSGTYSTNQSFGFPSGSGTASWDYTLTFEVQAVPIPAAAWLFVSGLIALTGLSRRKKA